MAVQIAGRHQINAIKPQQDAPAPMFSTLVEGFERLAQQDVSSPEAKRHAIAEYKDLLASGNSVGWGTVWNGELQKAAWKAYDNISGEGKFTFDFMRSLYKFARDLNGVERQTDIAVPVLDNANLTRPIPKTRIAWSQEPSTDSPPNWKNAALSSTSAALIYEKPEVYLDAMKKQGFKPADPEQPLLTSWTGAKASVAVRPDCSMVTFCGTEAAANDLATDAIAYIKDQAEYGSVNGDPVGIHLGFHTQLDSIWPQLKQQIETAKATNPDKPMVFAGHSLGAAMAQAAAIRAKEEGLVDPPEVVIHAFGKPNVGNADFEENFKNKSANFKVKYFSFEDDPITKVAPREMYFVRGSIGDTILSKTDYKDDRVRDDSFMQAAGDLMNNLEDHNEVNYNLFCLRKAGLE